MNKIMFTLFLIGALPAWGFLGILVGIYLSGMMFL